MGNQQKAQGKTILIVNQPSTSSPTQQPTQPAIVIPVHQSVIPESVRSSIKDITECILSVGPWVRKQREDLEESEFADTWRATKSTFNNQIRQPLCSYYSTLPGKLTQAKFDLINNYTYNQRFISLSALCALTAVAGITSSAQIDPFTRILRTTRNAGFVYLLGGLILAPEIYNPFIREL